MLRHPDGSRTLTITTPVQRDERARHALALDPREQPAFDVRVTLPIEFMPDALEEIEDLCAIARKLTHTAELGRIACGQADPEVRELIIDDNRLMYRIEDEQIVVLSAERFAPSLH